MFGIVSDDLFEKELKKSNPLSNSDFNRNSNKIPELDTELVITGEVIDTPIKGRKEGDNEVPDSLRKIIGEEHELNGRQSALQLASDFGISKQSVSAYANGSTSTKSYDKRPNLPHINNAKERVQNHARAKLTKALNHLTSEKLASAKAVDLATIAKSMSGIVKDMEPEPILNGPGTQGINSPTYVFYAPQIKTENHYETVIAKE